MNAKTKKTTSSEAIPVIFSALQRENPNYFGSALVTRESEYTDMMSIVGFVKPSDILVSKWHPGYRVSDLTGQYADEAIGMMLANTLTSIDRLSHFQNLLATPDVAMDIFTQLLPRANIAVKSRQYLMSEEMVRTVVSDRLLAKGYDDLAARVAYSHACIRVLMKLGIVQPGREQKSVSLAESYAISPLDIKRIVLTETLRDLFSEARMSSIAKELTENATPQIIGESVGRMFRSLSHVIPEVKLRLEYLDIATATVQLYHLKRNNVPNAIQAHPALISLASFANFIYFAEGRAVAADEIVTADVTTIKDACNAILSVLQSAPSIEAMPLKKYEAFFGEVPASAPNGIRRGLVLYASPSQSSRMEIADVRPLKDSIELAGVPNDYVKVPAIAPAISSALLTPDAITGLANIVADELSLTDFTISGDAQMRPVLLTLGVKPVDLVYLALAKAEVVAYVRQDENGPVSLIYGCNVAEQWKMTVSAATPSIAYFFDPTSVIMYQSAMVAKEAMGLPARNQSLGLTPNHDTLFIGDLDPLLIRNIEKPFTLKLPIVTYGGTTHVLDLEILVMSGLLGEDPDDYPTRGEAYYAAIREPGIDKDMQAMFQCALHYARDGGNILADRSKSWLVERLVPAMLHPVVVGMAQRAINRCVVKQRLDARALAPQFKEIVVKAYAGTLLAILTRFEKVDGGIVGEITHALPVSGLTVKSQLMVAGLPTALNAQLLKQ